MGDIKEEVVTTPLSDNKSSTKDVDKGTDEFEDMKKAVVTVCRKALDKFWGQSKISTGWFKLDSGFLKTTFSTIHSEFYKNVLKIILKIKKWNCIQSLLYRLINNISRKT